MLNTQLKYNLEQYLNKRICLNFSEQNIIGRVYGELTKNKGIEDDYNVCDLNVSVDFDKNNINYINENISPIIIFLKS